MRKRDIDRLTLSAARARADAAVAEQELAKLRLQVEQLRAAQQQPAPQQQQAAQQQPSTQQQRSGVETNPILQGQRPRSKLEVLQAQAAAGDQHSREVLGVRQEYDRLRALAREDPRGPQAIRARLFAAQHSQTLDMSSEPISLFAPRRRADSDSGAGSMGNGGGNSAA